MSPSAAADALTAPLREPALFLAGALFFLIVAAGLAIARVVPAALGILGLAALLVALYVALPALAGYTLDVIESTACRRPPPVAAWELFQPGSGDRRFAPLIPVALLLGADIVARARWPLLAGWLAPLAGALWLPASVMLLALTNSGFESNHPLRIARLYARLWPDCLWLLPALGLAWATVTATAGVNVVIPLALAIFWLLAVAVLCGRLLATLDIAAETEIAPPLDPDPVAVGAALLKAREATLNHAYGLASRGNRDGGFAHILEQVRSEADPSAADLWFFDAIWRWDLGEVPLFYGRALLARLLDAGDDVGAMKVASRCLAANPRFRPRADDLPRLRRAAAALGNRDLLAAFGEPRDAAP